MLQLTSEQINLLLLLLDEYTDILNDYHMYSGKFVTYTDVKRKYNQIIKLIQLGIIDED